MEIRSQDHTSLSPPPCLAMFCWCQRVHVNTAGLGMMQTRSSCLLLGGGPLSNLCRTFRWRSLQGLVGQGWCRGSIRRGSSLHLVPVTPCDFSRPQDGRLVSRGAFRSVGDDGFKLVAEDGGRATSNFQTSEVSLINLANLHFSSNF